MLEIHVNLFNCDPNCGAETAFDLAGRVYSAVPVSRQVASTAFSSHTQKTNSWSSGLEGLRRARRGAV